MVSNFCSRIQLLLVSIMFFTIFVNFFLRDRIDMDNFMGKRTVYTGLSVEIIRDGVKENLSQDTTILINTDSTVSSIDVMRVKNISQDITKQININSTVSPINEIQTKNNNLIIAPKYVRNYSQFLPFELYSIDNRKENELLPRGLSLNEYGQLMNLIEIVAKILSKNNMEYFIGYGTQLGNYKKIVVYLFLKDYTLNYILF